MRFFFQFDLKLFMFLYLFKGVGAYKFCKTKMIKWEFKILSHGIKNLQKHWFCTKIMLKIYLEIQKIVL